MLLLWYSKIISHCWQWSTHYSAEKSFVMCYYGSQFTGDNKGRHWRKVFYVYLYCHLERNAKLAFRQFLSFHFIPNLNCEILEFAETNKKCRLSYIILLFIVWLHVIMGKITGEKNEIYYIYYIKIYIKYILKIYGWKFLCLLLYNYIFT
jgi:hypothetical protein